jgi:hypothetical protein
MRELDPAMERSTIIERSMENNNPTMCKGSPETSCKRVRQQVGGRLGLRPAQSGSMSEQVLSNA